MSEVVSRYEAEPVQDLDASLTGGRFGLVLVCTPPHAHTDVARKAVAGGAHVFIEKPIAHALDGVDALLAEAEARARFVAVGYNLRFHRGIRLLKEAIDRGDVGVPLIFRAEVGQYLPDWRPASDYRAGYNAFAAQGGGIILDASHEIDYVRWLAGEVSSVVCMAGHLSSLEVEVEDAAAITMRTTNGAIAEIHLDSIQRVYSRNCKVIGEEGTLVWTYGADLMQFRASAGQWRTIPVVTDPNDMYIEEMKHVLECLEGTAPLVDGHAGRRVLEVALAARAAAASGREVLL